MVQEWQYYLNTNIVVENFCNWVFTFASAVDPCSQN